MVPKRKAAPAAAVVKDEDKDELTTVNVGTDDVGEGRVLYIGHVPHGFYEKEMKGFFSQFGTVTKVKLSRNKQTAKSKHYAFLEFESAEVAAIAAEAMDNYLMFGKILKCRVLAPSQVHPSTFKGANRKFMKKPWQKIEKERREVPRTEKQGKIMVKKLVEVEKARAKKLKAAGIDYEFDGYAKLAKGSGGKAALVDKEAVAAEAAAKEARRAAERERNSKPSKRQQKEINARKREKAAAKRGAAGEAEAPAPKKIKTEAPAAKAAPKGKGKASEAAAAGKATGKAAGKAAAAAPKAKTPAKAKATPAKKAAAKEEAEAEAPAPKAKTPAKTKAAAPKAAPKVASPKVAKAKAAPKAAAKKEKKPEPVEVPKADASEVPGISPVGRRTRSRGTAPATIKSPPTGTKRARK